MTSATAGELSVEVPLERPKSLGRFLPWVAIGGPVPLICSLAALILSDLPFQLHGNSYDDTDGFWLGLLAFPFAVLVLPVSISSGVAVLLFGENWGLGTATRLASATVTALTFAAGFAFLASVMS